MFDPPKADKCLLAFGEFDVYLLKLPCEACQYMLMIIGMHDDSAIIAIFKNTFRLKIRDPLYPNRNIILKIAIDEVKEPLLAFEVVSNVLI